MRKKTLDILRIQQRAGGGGASEFDWWQIGDNVVVAAYQPLGAADLADSYINLANPGTFDAAPGVAPTWAAGTGWTFNGSTQYLDSGVIQDNDQTWTFLIRYSGLTLSSTGRCIGGGRDTGPIANFYMFPDQAIDKLHFATGTESVSNSPAQAAGVMGIAGLDGYFDGSDVASIGAGTGAKGNVTIYLGARNTNASANSFFPGDIQAVAIYSTTLSSFEVAVMWLRMASLGM